jgi:hypothetical protein
VRALTRSTAIMKTLRNVILRGDPDERGPLAAKGAESEEVGAEATVEEEAQGTRAVLQLMEETTIR